MSERLNEKIGEMQEQLRQGLITRRSFLRYAALLGLSVGAAEALAACAPKATPTTAPTAKPPTAVPPAPTSVPVGAATAAPPAPPPTAAPPPAAPPTAAETAIWGREIYPLAKSVAMIEVEDMKCTGCELCQTACSMKHFGVIHKELARIQSEIRNTPVPKGLIVTCAQCQVEERECQKACPLTPPAIYYDDKLLHMVVDTKTCLGIKCNQCGEACSAKAIRWYTPVSATPLVCDLCDVAGDGTRDPECVKICPVTALHFRAPHAIRSAWRMSMEEKDELVSRRMYPLTKNSYLDPERKI